MGQGKAAGTCGSQVMRNDAGVNGGIVQIIPELSYIIQISFFFPLPLLFYLLSLACPLVRSPCAHSQFKQIWFLFLYVPVTSPAPLRGMCWDWKEDQVSHHSKACWERPRDRETKVWYIVLLCVCACDPFPGYYAFQVFSRYICGFLCYFFFTYIIHVLISVKFMVNWHLKTLQGALILNMSCQHFIHFWEQSSPFKSSHL